MTFSKVLALLGVLVGSIGRRQDTDRWQVPFNLAHLSRRRRCGRDDRQHRADLAGIFRGRHRPS